MYNRTLKSNGLEYVAARRIEETEDCIANLKLNAERVAPLYYFDTIYYEPFINHLEFLKNRAVKQLEILSGLEILSKKPEKELTLDELETARRLVSDARSMPDFEDSTVDVCEELVYCFDMADKAAKSVQSVKELSAADIAQTIIALTRFQHILPNEATKVIDQANAYVESIQAEMEEFVPRISSALSTNALKFNSQSGQLDGDISTTYLESALEGINDSELVSFECKRMVSLCHLCIKLRHMLASGDVESILSTVKKVIV